MLLSATVWPFERRARLPNSEVVSSASHLPRTGLILSRLPLEWRTHAAPALEPEGEWTYTPMSEWDQS